jgi:hypothetical protein
VKNSDGFADAFDTSLPGPAFSNSTEGDAWTTNWCRGCGNSYPDGDGCHLTDVALVGRIPSAWIEIDKATLGNRYLCLGWEPRAGVDGGGTQLADVLGLPVGRRS